MWCSQNVENESTKDFLTLDIETSNEALIQAKNALALCVKKALDEGPTLRDKDFEEISE